MKSLNKKYNVTAHFLLVIAVAVVIVGCGSSNRSAGDSPAYLNLVEKTRSLEFNIENDWANPSRGSRINLIGNSNYMRFKGDSVAVFLPYFGVRHSGGGYGSEGALVYEGPLEDLRVEEKPHKEQVELNFSGSHNSESLDFQVTIFPNGKTITSVGSSQRDRISYDGRIKEE